MSELNKSCFLCQVEVPASNVCEHCQSVFFCTIDHLKVHRGTIKAGTDVCWPFRIESRSGIGNVMVANRDIKATETILEEPPAAIGPNCKSKPVCLECLTPFIGAKKKNNEIKSEEKMSKNSDEKMSTDTQGMSTDKMKDEEYFCSKCGFPLCNEKCEQGPNHVSECPILSRWKTLKTDVNFYLDFFVLEQMAIFPVRIMRLSETNPELFGRVQLLMDHLQDVKTEERRVWERFVVGTIRDKCDFKLYSSDDLLRCIGIICTNAVSQGILRGQAVYPTFSFISHNCCNNSRFQIYGDRRIVLRAQLDIKAGDEVTVLYLPPIMGNLRRRKKIQTSWRFECQCQRCADKTEFGTMLDAVVCQKCKEESKVNGYLLPENSLDKESVWKCGNCPFEVNGLTIEAVLKGLEAEMEEMKEQNIEKVEQLIKNWSEVLHPTNFILLNLKKRALDLYRLHPEPDDDPVKRRLWIERQVELASEQLEVAEKLQPGYSLRRGRILRMLHGPFLKKAKMDLDAGLITPRQFVATTKVAIHRMKEAVKCLEDFDMRDNTDNDQLINGESSEEAGLAAD